MGCTHSKGKSRRGIRTVSLNPNGAKEPLQGSARGLTTTGTWNSADDLSWHPGNTGKSPRALLPLSSLTLHGRGVLHTEVRTSEHMDRRSEHMEQSSSGHGHALRSQLPGAASRLPHLLCDPNLPLSVSRVLTHKTKPVMTPNASACVQV